MHRIFFSRIVRLPFYSIRYFHLPHLLPKRLVRARSEVCRIYFCLFKHCKVAFGSVGGNVNIAVVACFHSYAIGGDIFVSHGSSLRHVDNSHVVYLVVGKVEVRSGYIHFEFHTAYVRDFLMRELRIYRLTIEGGELHLLVEAFGFLGGEEVRVVFAHHHVCLFVFLSEEVVLAVGRIGIGNMLWHNIFRSFASSELNGLLLEVRIAVLVGHSHPLVAIFALKGHLGVGFVLLMAFERFVEVVGPNAPVFALRGCIFCFRTCLRVPHAELRNAYSVCLFPPLLVLYCHLLVGWYVQYELWRNEDVHVVRLVGRRHLRYHVLTERRAAHNLALLAYREVKIAMSLNESAQDIEPSAHRASEVDGVWPCSS